MPLELFRHWTFTSNISFAMIMGVGMFGGLIFLPIYLQAVKGFTATQSGLAMLAARRRHLHHLDWRRTDHGAHGRYKWMPITGALVVGAALFAFSRLEVDTPYYRHRLDHVLVRLGLGFTMQVVVTAVQNSVDRETWVWRRPR